MALSSFGNSSENKLYALRRGRRGAFKSFYQEMRPLFKRWLKKQEGNFTEGQTNRLYQQRMQALYETIHTWPLAQIPEDPETYFYSFSREVVKTPENQPTAPINSNTQMLIREFLHESDKMTRQLLSLAYFEKLPKEEIKKRIGLPETASLPEKLRAYQEALQSKWEAASEQEPPSIEHLEEQIRLYFRMELYREFDKWDYEQESELLLKNDRVLRRQLYLVGTLSLGVLLLLGSYYYTQRKPRPAPRKLYEAYYRPYSDKPIRGWLQDSLSERPALKLAALAYQKKNYRVSQEALNRYAETHYPNDTVFFYQGLSLLALKNYRAAAKLLEPIQSSKTSVFAQTARWYLALTYLRIGNSERAKILLSLLRIKKSAYQRRAEKILKKFED